MYWTEACDKKNVTKGGMGTLCLPHSCDKRGRTQIVTKNPAGVFKTCSHGIFIFWVYIGFHRGIRVLHPRKSHFLGLYEGPSHVNYSTVFIYNSNFNLYSSVFVLKIPIKSSVIGTSMLFLPIAIFLLESANRHHYKTRSQAPTPRHLACQVHFRLPSVTCRDTDDSKHLAVWCLLNRCEA